MLGGSLRAAVLGVILLANPALAQDQAQEPERAGEVQRAYGSVQAQSLGAAPRALQRGDALYAQDRVYTGRRSGVDIRFSDGGRLQLGAHAEFELAGYRWQDQAGAFALRVSKGVFRLVSGLIGRYNRDQYNVNVGVATIGIRGTDFAGEVIGESARVVLLEAEDGAPTAIEVSNAYGSVLIDQPGYGTEIPDAHSPPSAPRRMRLEGVHNLMRSIGQVQRLPLQRTPPRRTPQGR